MRARISSGLGRSGSLTPESLRLGCNLFQSPEPDALRGLWGMDYWESPIPGSKLRHRSEQYPRLAKEPLGNTNDLPIKRKLPLLYLGRFRRFKFFFSKSKVIGNANKA